ncbi:MAG: ferrous iron transport protein B [Peptoniphilus sp.]|nr:ferrous iron transport protein B [Peptoniphilus sp.]
MGVHIALAGNPNSGKTTLFNALTGSNQYVGNWPGVTVEKKTGAYKRDGEIKFTDLPGIYSLSPYTLEEVVSRDFLLSGEADVIIDVIDASNIERNLYLATQLSELGIPLVLALNMMDVVRKNKDEIDSRKIEQKLNCRVVEISALKNEGMEELIEIAKSEALKSKRDVKINTFSEGVEFYLEEIEREVKALEDNPAKRWLAVKLFERDERISDNIHISKRESEFIDGLIERAEEEFDDDTEGIITDERYNFVSEITSKAVKKGRRGLSTSDKIDKIVTNRILALPIFVGVMFLIYYVAMTYVGGDVTDWLNEEFFGEMIGGNVEAFLSGIGTADWLTSLIVEGIIGGVGGVLGFLPVIATLFLFISLLEDVGYMARIAFILDRIFRRFGLSGKSFIPILMGTGCSVPGIMGTRTIENDRDRRMTIIVASFMPCGAKTDIIVMFSAVLGGHFWYGPLWYFGGIAAVVISGIILKKTERFKGDPAPFVMELPEYHFPAISNILKATWNRCKSFIIKAGTVILLCTVIIWFLQNISINFEFVEFADNSTDSILSFVGKKLSWIFAPLGFGNWMATVATVLGLIAKEVVVGTYGVVAGIGEVGADDPGLLPLIRQNFTTASMLSFMFFNQLTLPCFAAMGAIKEEMGDKKWFGFALGYQVVFSYTMALMVYQFSRVFIEGQPANAWTFVAAAVLVLYLYLLFRPAGKRGRLKVRSAEV